MIIIKKYENRRLYNTASSRYMNLEEVAAMVREGIDLQVIDAASGEDITRVILIQIIAEGAKAPNSAFPLDMLRQMVIASGKLTQDSVLNSMRTMFELYQNTYNAFTPPVAPLDLLQSLIRPKTTATNPPAPSAQDSVNTPSPGAVPPDVLALQRRIEDLEKKLSHPRRSANVSGRPRRKRKRK